MALRATRLQRPLDGVAVRLETPEGRVVARGVTGKDGAFALRSVAPGVYSLVGERAGFATATAIVTVDAKGAAADLTLASNRSAQPAGDGAASRRRAQRDRTPHRRHHLHADRPGDRRSARRRRHSTQSNAVAGAGRQPGFVRPNPSAQRPRQCSISHRRRDPARGHRFFRPEPDLALRVVARPHHRLAAGAVRALHHGDRRHPDQERRVRAGRLGRPIRRQSRLVRAERRVRRLGGKFQLLRRRRLHAERYRNRKSDRFLSSDPRFHPAASRLRLSRGHYRSERARSASSSAAIRARSRFPTIPARRRCSQYGAKPASIRRSSTRPSRRATTTPPSLI